MNVLLAVHVSSLLSSLAKWVVSALAAPLLRQNSNISPIQWQGEAETMIC